MKKQVFIDVVTIGSAQGTQGVIRHALTRERLGCGPVVEFDRINEARWTACLVAKARGWEVLGC